MKYILILLVLLTACTFKVQAETNTVSSTVSSNTVTSVDKAPPTASAPNLMINQGICQVPASIGLQSSFVGVATAKGFVDTDCNIRAYSRLLYSYGMKIAAVSLISNSDPAVFDAMWFSGTYAPINSKIGIDAKEEWSKPENIPLIPDGSKVKEILLKNLEAKKEEETDDKKEVKHTASGIITMLLFTAIIL